MCKNRVTFALAKGFVQGNCIKGMKGTEKANEELSFHGQVEFAMCFCYMDSKNMKHQ